MSDLIDRQAAIDAMKSISDSICEQQAIDALCDLPSTQPEPRWIPVTERLPAVFYDKYGNEGSPTVIFCTASGRVETGNFCTSGFFQQWEEDGPAIAGSLHEGADDYYRVTAWMPLPEPYREEASQ